MGLTESTIATRTNQTSIMKTKTKNIYIPIMAVIMTMTIIARIIVIYKTCKRLLPNDEGYRHVYFKVLHLIPFF